MNMAVSENIQSQYSGSNVVIIFLQNLMVKFFLCKVINDKKTA